MENLINEFSVGLFLWQTILFVGLVFLLRKFAWKPILKTVSDREQFIEDSIETAKQAKIEMERIKNDSESLLKEAREERDVILKEARETRNSIVEEAKGKAKSEADKVLAQAKESINNEKMAAITELKNSVATLSIEIAEKILKEELSSEDKQKALVDNLMKDVNLN